MSTDQTKSKISNNIRWYQDKRPVYKQLSKKVETILSEIISIKEIHVHAISSRTKTIDSFEKKIEGLKYNDPINQITDFSGIRIITYVESDLQLICELIRTNFIIDPKNSEDKTSLLGIDKVGYRSIHFICQMPYDRIKLEEYKKFNGLFFEIQVRTLLQHSWAEIEHDKDYKFSGVLPDNLKRRFKILAGLLELADREFNNLAFEIENHRDSIISDTKKGNLEIKIDGTSVKLFFKVKFENLLKKGLKPTFFNDNYEKIIFDELSLFGIETLDDLNKIIPNDFSEKIIMSETINTIHNQNYAGLLRELMIIFDSQRYFEYCWRKDWFSIHPNTIKLLKLYNIPIEKYMDEFELDITY